MIIGLDTYGDEEMIHQITNPIANIYRLELQNCVVDTIKIDSDGSLPYSSLKEEWLYSTVFLADFKNNLEAGNIDNKGLPIEYIQFKKRNIDDLAWETIITLPFNSLETIYTFTDRLVQSTEQYEYAIIPITASVEGEYTSANIECSFEGTWLCDRVDGYQLLYNLQYDAIENVVPSKVFNPLSQYPIVVYGENDYKKGSIKSLVLSNNYDGKINPRQERLTREQLMKFLKNKKPKILKDYAGRYYVVSVIGNPQEFPNNNLSQTISDVSFDWVEIADPQSYRF